jgi:hypothetical protein
MTSPTFLYLLAVEQRERRYAEGRAARLAKHVRQTTPTTRPRHGFGRRRGDEPIA